MRYPVIGQRYKKSGMQKFETNGRSPSNYGCLLNAAPHNPGIELGQRENQIRTTGLELVPSNRGLSGTRGSRLWSLDDILGLGAMSKEITFQDITGEPVSGRFEVSEGLITVTLPDGRKTTADIEESMLSPEILARVLLLQMHRAKQPDAKSEDLLED
jgi:hypothetical protein